MGRLSYLLDSNILSESSRPRPHVNVQSRLLAHRHEVCTAAPVLHEMRYGIALMPEGRRKRALTGYLEQVLNQPLTVLPYDREAALWYAEERARLRLSRAHTPFIDGQIAAIAGFAGLTVENWFA